MSSPHVSIIIPAYNSARYLRECLDSVLRQTYHDFEVIVVDDGSTDGTREIAMEYIANLPDRMGCLFQHNLGPGAARNHGIRKSTGSHIAFLDSDDIWKPEKIALQVAYMEANPGLALIAAEFEVIDSGGLVMGRSKRYYEIDFNGPNVVRDIFKHYLLMSSIMVKREVFDRVGYFDENIINSEDTDMQIRIARHFKIGIINAHLVKYRSSEDSLSKSLDTKKILKRWRDRMKVIRRFLKNNNEYAEINKASVVDTLVSTYRDYAVALLSVNKFKWALVYVRRALSLELSPLTLGIYFKIILMRFMGKKGSDYLRLMKKARVFTSQKINILI